MSVRVGLVFLMAALAGMATVAHSSDHPIYFGLGGSYGDGLVVEAMDHLDQEMMMDSDSVRRQLGQAGYVSYGALNRNNVPCNQRGQSYYNCRDHQNANPYNRGCTRVTNCARNSRWTYFSISSYVAPLMYASHLCFNISDVSVWWET